MEINLSQALASLLQLARNFVVKIYEEKNVVAGPKTRLDLLIDELIPLCDKSNRQDRTLLQTLRSFKRVLAKTSGNLPKDQTALENELRTTLLNCGFDSATIEAAVLQNFGVEPINDITPEIQPDQSEPKADSTSPEKFEEAPDVLANRLKEEGNKHFTATDYKNSLIHYERVLSMSGIANDIFVKAASNAVAALLAWDGTTRKLMEAAVANMIKATSMEPSNAKLFYRLGQAQEWLGDLKSAKKNLLIASTISPHNEEIATKFENIKQKICYLDAKEHSDERYRTKSMREVKQKFAAMYPGLDYDKFLDIFGESDFPGAYVMRGQIERDEKKNYVAAFKFFERAAKKNNPEGMLNLSDLYLKGLGVEQDVYKAVEWLRKAVVHDPNQPGVVESYVALGLKYYRGTGVPRDMAQAKFWFQKAADQGCAEGELNLGCVLSGEGNFEEAFEMFKSAAVKGCARAYANLGDFYRDGLYVKKDLAKARQMYQKAVSYGLSLDIEAEIKNSRDLLSKLFEAWVEHDVKKAKKDRIKVKMTAEAIEDLELRAKDDPMARSILVGWLNYLQGIQALNSIKKETHAEFILEMFSSAIQACGHFLRLTEEAEYHLNTIVDYALTNPTGANPVDLAVCAFYLQNFHPNLSFSASNPYLAIQMAQKEKENGNLREALKVIDFALQQNPQDLELLFHKARILDPFPHAMLIYSEFSALAPMNHYWSPHVFYLSGIMFMTTNHEEAAICAYKCGRQAERHQLKLFQDYDWEERKTLAVYLLEHNKLPRYPPFLKTKDARRKELIMHHHNALQGHLKILSSAKYSTVVKNTLNEHRRQPNPTAESRRKEFFFDELDLTKEHIYEGFIDCLILAPPLKNFGIVTVVEDKRANTCRALLYDISLVHVKVGQWVRIYNPYIRIASDHRSAIKVTNARCFEVLQYESICHYCTELLTADRDAYTCIGCNIAEYCSMNCYEKHFNGYQHSKCCALLSFKQM